MILALHLNCSKFYKQSNFKTLEHLTLNQRILVLNLLVVVSNLRQVWYIPL